MMPDRPEQKNPAAPVEERNSGRLLVRNMGLNLAGLGAPLIAAAFAMPALDTGLGTDRYGLFLIVLMVLGYFSLFDLGLGRALTQLLARSLEEEEPRRTAALVWTALALTAALGVAGGGLLLTFAPELAGVLVTNVGPEVYADCLRALYVLALAVPVVAVTASLRGVLEAAQRFDLVNAIRVPTGVFMFAAPLLILPFAPTLTAVVAVLAATRLIGLGVHAYCCTLVLPALTRYFVLDAPLVRSLLRFGGWMTVSNLVSPLMVQVDRIVIGAVLSLSAVAYYATPWEVVTKLLIVPGACASVLFPAFSYWQAKEQAQLSRLYYGGLKLVGLLLFAGALAAVLAAEPLLLAWMGPEYAANGFRPMQILAVGVFLNGIATIPFAMVQGAGRADVTAKLHLLELPVYAALLWTLAQEFGLAGVALAWAARSLLDLVLLLAACKRLIEREARATLQAVGAVTGAGLFLGIAAVPTGAAAALYGLVVLVAAAGFAWRYVLAPAERLLVGGYASRLSRRFAATSVSEEARSGLP